MHIVPLHAVIVVVVVGVVGCLGGVVVSVSDSCPEGRGFDSWPPHYHSPRSTQPSIPPG